LGTGLSGRRDGQEISLAWLLFKCLSTQYPASVKKASFAGDFLAGAELPCDNQDEK
jgi:hypothetical protein